MSEHLRKNYNLETAIYSGRDEVEDELFEHFDYVKVGSYQADKGPLNKETTNQRLYYHREDITSKFWNRKK
jgi:anaerobic ribonucleoside-triphosphate reductase activating protein